MPRPLRPDIEGGWHHVMNRGIDHADVFFSDNDRVEFGQRLADTHEHFGVEFHAYCLMDNHYHLLVHCPTGGLSDAMQRLGSLYTRHVNDRLGRDGALFRGRFHSRQVTTDAHLQATVRYIHRNALDLDGVDQVRNYRWSSHRAYLGLRTPPQWLRTEVVFAGWTAAEFDRFVDAPLHETADIDLDPSQLVNAIEFVLAERGHHVERRSGALARQLALQWFADERRTPEASLMVAFQIVRTGALRTAIWRARALIRDEPDLVEVQSLAISLVTNAVSHRGSDPGCDQTAARAAS